MVVILSVPPKADEVIGNDMDKIGQYRKQFAQLFVKAQIKETINGPCQWPLRGESTGDRWIPLTEG